MDSFNGEWRIQRTRYGLSLKAMRLIKKHGGQAKFASVVRDRDGLVLTRPGTLLPIKGPIANVYQAFDQIVTRAVADEAGRVEGRVYVKDASPVILLLEQIILPYTRG